MKFTVGEWQTLSRLFDEAMDLPEDARADWLESLDAAYASLQPALRHMLVRQAKAETDDFLNTLPKFDDVQLGNPTKWQLPSLTARVAVGPYRLVRELGRGGMGAVWLAERIDGLIKRPVALKLPHPGHYNSQLGERFSRERDILASLVHPNIGKLFDAGVTEAGQSYLALEYVEGATITEYCDRVGLPLRSRLELFLQVLEAVQYAHSRLVIHRDLKPTNILVTDERKVVLLDFGIAKLTIDGQAKETELTQLGGRALTPDYASPEQIAGQAITTASDVYSLGIVLYELLTGERPYKLSRDSPAALEEAILNVDPPKPSLTVKDAVKAVARSTTAKKLAKTLQGDLDTIVLKSLKKAPNERYATADAFAQDIERYLAGEAVLAQPESISYRARKFLGRNKLAAASTAAVFVALAAGLSVALWQADKAREQARIASEQSTLARGEAKRAQAVQGFLLDIFKTNSDTQKDPLKARQTTARELLDIGAKRVKAELKDTPDSQQEVLATLSDMYYELGLDEQSADLQGQRIQILKQFYGAHHVKVAAALVAYASSLHATGRRDQILPALDEAKAILDVNHDVSSTTRGELLIRLAQRHQNISYEKMLAYADEAAALFKQYHADDKDQLSSALHLAARARALLGDYEAAEPLYRESLEELQKLDSAAENSVIPTLFYLAETQAMLLKIPEAEQSYRAALERALKRSGDLHANTIQSETRLAAFLHATSRREEARRLHESALRKALQTKGEADTLTTPQVRMDYGRSLLAEGRLQEAEAKIAKVIESNRRNYPASAVLANGIRVQSALYTTFGRYTEAQQLFDEALAMWGKPLGPRHRSVED